MSTQWLPDVKRILSLARNYRRACGHMNRAYAALEACGEERSEKRRLRYVEWRLAVEETKRKSDALLRFIETGKFEKRARIDR